MRGIFEHPAGSGVWWVNYYVEGKRHREKVGRKSDATDLYHTRKADARAGRKLPELRSSRKVTISDLIDLALQYTAEHKDKRSYITKAAIVRASMGSRTAEQVTPLEIDQWLRARNVAPATTNRYKSFLSLCYREGLRNGKVNVNPARLVRQRKEPTGRKRFLSRPEYDKLLHIIREQYPEHVEEFIVSVYSGMRLSEQFTLQWNQVFLDRRAIELSKTKNGSERTVGLRKQAVAALTALKRKGQTGRDLLWTWTGEAFGTRSWFTAVVELAGIEDYTWHNNRHTFCSWLAMDGATLREIQEMAGHKTISMSARYAHLSPEHSMSVLDRLDRIG